ncbi:transposase-like protein [Sphingomonas sp. UYP23]
MNAEMDHHLAGEDGAGNTRNGYGRKTVMTDTGKMAIDVPRDRQASFDPQLIAKYQRRFQGFDEKIASMYARGMSTREITGYLQDLYGIDVSPDLISTVTDAVLDEVATWQQRPLDPVYPLVFFDAIRIKIRDEGMVRNKAIHIALGVRFHHCDLLNSVESAMIGHGISATLDPCVIDRACGGDFGQALDGPEP